MSNALRRPERWDHPLDPAMSEARLAPLLELEPWATMHREQPEKIVKLLCHESRLLRRDRGEILVREGDYGNSAFFILAGAVCVVVEKPGLSRREEGRAESPRKSFFGALSQLWRNRREPEARRRPDERLDELLRRSAEEEFVPIVLKDVDAVLDRRRTARLEAGEVFGEIAALGRTPRTATVFTDEDATELLEVRWQGLRDLRRQFPSFKAHLDARFRTRALISHLQATPIFSRVGDTPRIRACLAGDRLEELFIDCLGCTRPQARPVEFAFAGERLRFQPVAATLSDDGVTVWTCDSRSERLLESPAARGEVLDRLTEKSASRAVVAYLGAPGGGRLWQWRTTEPGSEGHGSECREQADPTELCRRLLRLFALDEIVRVAEFQNYGEFDAGSRAVPLEAEPIVAAEGQYPNGVIMVRAGFARVSEEFRGEERTVSYLGPGRAYGFVEIAHNWREPDRAVSLRKTLRAVGYLDTVAIPTVAIERFVLPSIPQSELPRLPAPVDAADVDPLDALLTPSGVDRSLVEFLVDRRLTNGTAAMVIDLDRCTRCDDCVRACAAAHDDNPRFLRHGPTQGRFMIANACMHCVDPVCMIGCPTGAISRESATGQVVINDATCIGCASCANNCPYFNIRMVETRSPDGDFYVDARNQAHAKATKCDLCLDQLGGPACQRACPHDALRRIGLGDLSTIAGWVGR